MRHYRIIKREIIKLKSKSTMYVIQERYWFFGKRWRNTYNENGEECTYTYKESAKDMYNELILKQTKPQIIESIVETTDEKLLRLVEKIGIK